MMFKRKRKHLHTWKAIGARYRGPTRFDASWASERMIRELVDGVTTVTQLCETCGRVDSTRHIGKLSLEHLGLKWS
jgi:hypothetical protein